MVYEVNYVNSNNVEKFSEDIQELYELGQVEQGSISLDPFMDKKILVIKDNDGERYFMDGSEPEDNLFDRDWHWVIKELKKAYLQGLKDGKKRIGEGH